MYQVPLEQPSDLQPGTSLPLPGSVLVAEDFHRGAEQLAQQLTQAEKELLLIVRGIFDARSTSFADFPQGSPQRFLLAVMCFPQEVLECFSVAAQRLLVPGGPGDQWRVLSGLGKKLDAAVQTMHPGAPRFVVTEGWLRSVSLPVNLIAAERERLAQIEVLKEAVRRIESCELAPVVEMASTKGNRQASPGAPFEACLVGGETVAIEPPGDVPADAPLAAEDEPPSAGMTLPVADLTRLMPRPAPPVTLPTGMTSGESATTVAMPQETVQITPVVPADPGRVRRTPTFPRKELAESREPVSTSAWTVPSPEACDPKEALGLHAVHIDTATLRLQMMRQERADIILPRTPTPTGAYELGDPNVPVPRKKPVSFNALRMHAFNAGVQQVVARAGLTDLSLDPHPNPATKEPPTITTDQFHPSLREAAHGRFVNPDDSKSSAPAAAQDGIEDPLDGITAWPVGDAPDGLSQVRPKFVLKKDQPTDQPGDHMLSSEDLFGEITGRIDAPDPGGDTKE